MTAWIILCCVNAPEHYGGGVKPRSYYEHKDEFKQFSDKIIYVCADEPPEVIAKDDDWAIEFYQRNAIQNGLRNAQGEDVIILSDVDEFYNPEILSAIRTNRTYPYRLHLVHKEAGRKRFLLQCLAMFTRAPFLSFRKPRLHDFLQKSCFAVEQDFFYYFMNYKRGEKWHGTVFCLYKNISTLQNLRNRRNVMPYLFSRTVQTGWHFSYLGGKERIINKLKSIVEGSHIPVDEKCLDEHIERCIKEGKDLFERNDERFVLLEEKDLHFPNLADAITRMPYLWHS